MWFKETLQQLIINQNALIKAKLNAYNHQPVKIPLIEPFTEDRSKLKGFFIQVKIQIDNEGLRLPTFFEKVVYAGMYLTRKPVKWI